MITVAGEETIVMFPCKEIKSSSGLTPGCLVTRKSWASKTFWSHPYEGQTGIDLPPTAGPFLYLKTIEYEHDTEYEPGTGFQFDVILWEDKILEFQTGRLKRFIVPGN